MTTELDNVLIHVGFHKTATTWLLKKMFTSESCVFEPLSFQSSGPSRFARNFYLDGESNILSPFDNNEARIRRKLEELIKNKEALSSKIPVLSHERLSGNPHKGGVDSKKIASMLKNTFPCGKVFIVIREQKSFMLSIYFQFLSMGGTIGLNRYSGIKRDGGMRNFSHHHVAYLPLITEYLESNRELGKLIEIDLSRYGYH